MQSRLKSAKEHWSFFTAAVRVIYALAAPAFPFCFKRPIIVLSVAGKAFFVHSHNTWGEDIGEDETRRDAGCCFRAIQD